jgi:hypothetical protein
VGDFFTPFPGGPLPPEEPDIKAPDFETIANGLSAGFAKSGIANGFLGGLLQTLVRWVTIVLGLLITGLLNIFAKFAQILGDATTDSQAAYNNLVVQTLHELFGVVVSPADVATRTSGPGREAAASAIGKTIIGTMLQGATPVDGGGIVPSDAAATGFMGAALKMQLNGWIESFVMDGLSYHLLEKYGDLKDGIERTLGMGRMMRAAFRAPMKIFATDPYMALLEQKYRTRPWEVKALMARLNRGTIQRADLSKPLGDLGYTEAQIDELVIASQKTLSLNELDYMDQRGIAIGDFVKATLISDGYTPGAADTIIANMRDRRLQKYRIEMVNVSETAFVAGNIDLTQLQQVVSQSGVTTDEQNYMLQLAQLKRSLKITHLTEGQIIQGIEDGVMNFNDLKAWAQRENMPLTEEALLELEVQFRENKAAALAKAKAATAAAKVQAANAKLQIAQQKAAKAKLQASDAGLSPAQAATLVKEHFWTTAEYSTFLTDRGYGPDAVQANLELLQAEMNATAVKTAAAAITRASAAAKGINVAQMEKAVIEGITTIDKLQSFLIGHNYSADDAQIIVDLTQNALTAAQQKADAKKAAAAAASKKSVSLPEIERAVLLGITSIDTYTAALQNAHFDTGSIALLTGILKADEAKASATAAKSAAASAKAATQGVSLPQLEQEVIAGIRPISDYSAALLKLNYQMDDRIDLTQLLQLKVDQAKTTQAKRDAAAAALSKRGISLADAERAVKLGIVPISVYQSLLSSLHYTPDAINVLSNSLIAQMAATRKAQTAATAAGTALAPKSISLSDLEKAVVAGIKPIGDYTAALIAAKYPKADADTLTQLVQLKVDQAAAAAARHADAVGAATKKGISLAAEEAAVVAGDRTMDDYDALLTALEYDDVDRATLEQLLQAKVDAKAAKDAAAAPAPAGGTASPSSGG